MNKNSIVNIGLGIAVLVLYILHFNSSNTAEIVVEDQLVKEDTVAFEIDDSLEVKEAVASKVAYFNLEDLVASCGYLNRKTQAMMEKERRLYASTEAKGREFDQWQQNKQRELEGYREKGMLVQSHVESAQRQGMEKQQQLQLELKREEQNLMEENQKFAMERDKIISDAMTELNKKAGWDYVLVDNHQMRLVIPFNEENNVTENLASIINKKYGK